MLNKLDAYIVKKFLGTFIFMVLIILAVTVVIDIAEKIDDFIEYKPPIDKLIFSYYVNFCLFFGNLLSPICIFLAVIFFTSRLTSNTEIVAMLSGGISFWRVMATYLITASVLALGSFYLNAYVVPIATKNRIEFEYEHLKKKQDNRMSNIHKKIGNNAETGEETFIYLYNFSQYSQRGTLFTMEVMRDKDIVKKIEANEIVWQDSLKSWHLQDVKIHTFNGRQENIYQLPSMDTTMLLTPDDIIIKDMHAESIPLNILSENIALEELRGSGLEEELTMELYRRYAYPFAAIILTLIGFSVSTKKRRGGTPLQIGIGLVFAFVYVLLVVAGQAIIGDKLPAWVAVWLPNGLFFLVALFLLRLAPK
jgi:lipopolysaccharide export system permease protein